MDLSAFEANYRPFQLKQEQSDKPKAGGWKAMAASLLPTIGGAVGAVGGSFVAPIAGTAAGGAAGSAMGEALRQKITGEDFSAKRLATEGALGAVPGVFKGAKAGVTALKTGKAARAAQVAEEAARQGSAASNIGKLGVGAEAQAGRDAAARQIAEAQQFNSMAKQNVQNLAQKSSTRGLPVGESGQGGVLVKPEATPSLASEGVNLKPVPELPYAPDRALTPRSRVEPSAVTATTQKPTLLSKFSTNATKQASGLKIDPSVGGIERADEAAQTFQRLKISGTPEQQLRKINQTMASHGKQVDEILSKNPIQLDGALVKEQAAKAIEDPLKYAELDLSTPGAQRALNTHLDKFAQAKTAKEVNDYVKVLNKVAVRAQGKLDRGLSLTDKESAALAAKKAGDEVLSQYPEIAPLKKDMAILFERNGDVTKRSTKTVGVPILGVKSKAASQAAANVASKAGQTAAKVDAALQTPTANTTKKVGKSLFSQFATRAVASPVIADQGNSTPINQNTANITSATTTMPISNPSIDALYQNGEQNASENDPTAGLDAAIQQALAAGDYKGLSALMSVADYYQRKSTTGVNKPLSAEASKVISNAQTGIQALDDFQRAVEEDTSVLTKRLVPGRGAFGGALGGALGTRGADAAAAQIVDVIARLRTGAAITNDEAKRFETFIPQAGDPQDVRTQKINYLKNQFEMVANRSGSAGTDTQAALGVQ